MIEAIMVTANEGYVRLLFHDDASVEKEQSI